MHDEAVGWSEVGVRYYPFEARDAVGPVSLTVRRGERLLLLGPLGAGKSTLLATLTGLVPHSVPAQVEGRIRLMGRDVKERSPAQWSDTASWLLQDAEQTLCGMTVADEIAFALENRGLEAGAIAQAVEAAMADVGIPASWRDRRTANLSGGEKQLIALAAVIAQRTPLVVADEPSAHLAPEAADRLRALLLDKRPERSVLIVDHRLDGLLDKVDRVAVLGRDGGLLAVDAPRPLFRARGAELARLGIWRPAAAALDERLAEVGLAPETPPLTIAEALRPIDPPPPGKRGEAAAAVAAFVAGRVCADAAPISNQPVARLVDAACAPLFGPVVLKGVTLSVHPGETVAVLGRNGAGKSTLAATLAGVLRLKGGRREGAMGGIAFQNPESQLIAGTVVDEIAGALDAGLPAEERQRRASGLLAEWDLNGLARKHPFELSQGQKRRLALLSLVAADRWPLLVLDEPTAGLDASGVAALAKRIGSLAAAGRAVAIVTHDIDFALATCARAVVVGDGGIVADRRMTEVAADPALLEAAGLREPAVMPALRWLERHAPC